MDAPFRTAALTALVFVLSMMPHAALGAPPVQQLRSKGSTLYADSYARGSCVADGGDWEWHLSVGETVYRTKNLDPSVELPPAANVYFSVYKYTGIPGTYTASFSDLFGNTTAELGLTSFSVSKAGTTATLVGTFTTTANVLEDFNVVATVPVVVTANLQWGCDGGSTSSGRQMVMRSTPDGNTENFSYVGNSCEAGINPARFITVSVGGVPLVCAPGGNPVDDTFGFLSYLYVKDDGIAITRRSKV